MGNACCKRLDHCVESVLPKPRRLRTKSHAQRVVSFISTAPRVCPINQRAEMENALSPLWFSLLLSITWCVATASLFKVISTHHSGTSKLCFFVLGSCDWEISIYHQSSILLPTGYFFPERNFDFLILKVMHVHNIFGHCKETKNRITTPSSVLQT